MADKPDPWGVSSDAAISTSAAPQATQDQWGVSGAPPPAAVAPPAQDGGSPILNGIKSAASDVADLYRRATNYRDTQTVKAAAGIAGIPRMIGDATNWAGRQFGMTPQDVLNVPYVGPLATLSKLPSGQEVSDTLLKQAAKVPNFKERNINPVVDAGVQALIAGPVLGAGGKFAPLINFGGGAGSEAGGELGKYLDERLGTNMEPYFRIGGAVLGGGGGLGAGALAGKTGSVVRATAAPFTEAGREALAGRALNSAAANPADAVAALDRYSNATAAYPSAVPGFRLDAGKASRDPGLMQLAETAQPHNPSMRATYNDNNVAVTNALDRAGAGLPPASESGNIIQSELRNRFDALDTARTKASSPLYDAARNSTTPVDPVAAWMLAKQAAENNVGKPQTLMNEVSGFFENPTGPSPSTPRGMMAIRDAVGDLQGEQSVGRYGKSLLRDVKGEIDKSLSAVPEEQQARATFQQYSKPLEPFSADLGNKNVAGAIEKDQFGKNFLMPGEKVPSQFVKPGDLSAPSMQKFLDANGGNPKGLAAMRSYLINDFRDSATAPVAQDAAGNPRALASGAESWLANNRAGAAKVLTPEQMGALDDIRRHLTDQAQTVPGRIGSPTYDRLATESIVGALLSPKFSKIPFMHAVNKGLGLVYGGADEAVRNKLFQAIADPDVARALMRKATPQNVNLAQPVLRRFMAGAAASASLPGGKDTQ